MAKDLDPRGPTRPKRKMKDQQVLIHDLFKLLVSVHKKNVSWQKGIVKIVEIEHCHFFHTIDSTGIPNDACVPVSGHFHKVEWGFNETTGEPFLKCGPPLHKVSRKTPLGVKTFTEQIEYEEIDQST